MGGRGGKGNVNGFIDWLSKEGKGGGSPHPLDISKFGNMSLEDVLRVPMIENIIQQLVIVGGDDIFDIDIRHWASPPHRQGCWWV